MTCTSLTQPILATDIGLRFLTQGEHGRRRHVGLVGRSAIHQPVKQVQQIGLGGHARVQRHLNGAEHGLFVMLKTKDKISTISQSPPGLRSIRLWSFRKALGMSTKGAPLRSAPGLRWSTAR